MKSRKRECVLAGIFAFMLAGCVRTQPVELSGFHTQEETVREAGESSADETPAQSGAQSSGMQTQPEVCCVFVCGAVQEPGVYELPWGSRVYEALALAGGVTENGAYMAVNQVDLVYDGQQIYIPEVGEYEQQQESVRQSESGLVNINTASKEELMTLNGIGESRAEAIIAYREEHGSFSAIEEVMEIPGIKEAAFQKIKDSITVK